MFVFPSLPIRSSAFLFLCSTVACGQSRTPSDTRTDGRTRRTRPARASSFLLLPRISRHIHTYASTCRAAVPVEAPFRPSLPERLVPQLVFPSYFVPFLLASCLLTRSSSSKTRSRGASSSLSQKASNLKNRRAIRISRDTRRTTRAHTSHTLTPQLKPNSFLLLTRAPPLTQDDDDRTDTRSSLLPPPDEDFMLTHQDHQHHNTLKTNRRQRGHVMSVNQEQIISAAAKSRSGCFVPFSFSCLFVLPRSGDTRVAQSCPPPLPSPDHSSLS